MFKQPNRTIFIPVCCFAFWFSVCMSLGRLYTFVLSTGAYVFNCQPAPLRTRTFEEHEFWMKNQEPVASMLDAAFEAWRRRWASGSHPQRSKVKIGKIWQNSHVGHLFEMLSGMSSTKYWIYKQKLTSCIKPYETSIIYCNHPTRS